MKPVPLLTFAAVLAAGQPVGRLALDYGPRPLPVAYAAGILAAYFLALVAAAAWAAPKR